MNEGLVVNTVRVLVERTGWRRLRHLVEVFRLSSLCEGCLLALLVGDCAASMRRVRFELERGCPTRSVPKGFQLRQLTPSNGRIDRFVATTKFGHTPTECQGSLMAAAP